MRFRASDVAAATGGRLVGPDAALDGVSFDSRRVAASQLFVPLIAERDGHDFIGAAVAGGAAAYLTSRPAQGGSAVEVADTLQALMDLARVRRAQFHGTVIGITGSVGKTSTKDLARAALSASRRTWANEHSFNNDQGLPTTVLDAPDDTEVLVLEMGMRGPGEIARLCTIAAPTIGVVTRVAEAHGDLLGGIEGVAAAKAELVRSLPAGGTAVLNADDPRVVAMRAVSSASVVTFGESSMADVRIGSVELDHLARPSFTVHSPWGTVAVRLAISGRHMIGNAAAALAIVGVVGADVEAGAAALVDVGLTPMRMQLVRSASGGIVIDDSYNASPTSMRAALDALGALPARRRVAVLGLMAEISDASTEHLAIAAYAAERDIALIAVGTDLYGVEPTVDPAAVIGSVAGGEAVLVKGSRVVGLERWVAVLQAL
jgi:UDP-N-acetylmuramoyl-tripeptide--D-alanyl-D-alanine ligase